MILRGLAAPIRGLAAPKPFWTTPFWFFFMDRDFSRSYFGDGEGQQSSVSKEIKSMEPLDPSL